MNSLFWGAQRDSNPRHSETQSDSLTSCTMGTIKISAKVRFFLYYQKIIAFFVPI